MNRGGKREGAGRKPVEDKKQQITLYIRKSIVSSFGGVSELKRFLYNLINHG